ncbi:DNA alkylation repair protein [Flavihumibacter fluvii]|uniref:DNA alkylation repair protein n=1 Tax=Flavihumibacter fluvii TaxID=2838157 RepID=UPI001BDF32A2|nr:DNA alkylation repair protein [Flavihumibacter fluvii]ULQ53413.1 DNA alkylation repair protein [Flavihumibacter fluvii]
MVKSSYTAKAFIHDLVEMRSAVGVNNSRFYKDEGDGNEFLDVRMANIFALAKAYIKMPVADIEQLLDNKYYEVRMGAVSIMDFQARERKVTDETRQSLFELYINRHDSINNWDMVDRSAPYVVGGYLFDRDRTILYQLARSKNIWERRTSIVSTYYFIRKNEVNDTFKIAELLIHDKQDLVNKAAGSWIREAGKRDPKRLVSFLEKHAPTMPRVALRYAIEKLDKKQKAYFMEQTKRSIS